MITENNTISNGFFWLNEPEYEVRDSKLIVTTSPHTDFWQKTHYGFEHDNGHCLLTRVEEDFSLVVKTYYYPLHQYDQCGLMVRLDANNWIKASTEYETGHHSRLGSVVTNRGYSDWATIDVFEKVTMLWYRIQSRGFNDFLIEYSRDGNDWKQLRITHLHETYSELHVGIYACSPMQGSFTAAFEGLVLSDSNWR